MELEYRWKRHRKSWNFTLGGRRVTTGFWLQTTKDNVSKKETSKQFPHEYDKKFKYSPLESRDHIRILELEPGMPNDLLRGRLIHNPSVLSEENQRSLKWSIEYEALSYTWGQSSPDRNPRIFLDGGRYLDILPNLEAALRHLRSPNARKIFWSDAICINQEDYMERNNQVAIMMEIYAKAETVHIWLGPAAIHSTGGMEVLKYLAESTLQEPAPWLEHPETDFVTGLREVIGRDWFSRIWVVQEAAVSQKAHMMCGTDDFWWTNDPVLLQKFIRRIKFAAISPQWEQAGLTQINVGSFLQILNLQMQHIERQQNQVFTAPSDILDIAFELRHRKSTDPRDKLFAILGLTKQGDQSVFLPDYEQNVEAVFQRLLDSVEI